MIIGNNRTEFDTVLVTDVRTVILLLRGAETGSKAREVYDFINNTRATGERKYDPFQHQVLVTNDGKVTEAELQDWFNSGLDRYAVLRNRTPTSPKIVVKRGPMSDLLFTDGNREPAYTQIRIAFLAQ